MVKRRIPRVLAWLEAALAWGGHAFVDRWGRLERSYRRPYARIALRLRFAFYPLLALAALSWLAWDWQHDRNLASAENAIFDQVIKLRPWEPTPSGRVAVVEIDDCSIARIGPWPWSRQQHADLLDALDRAGASAVGYDVMFLEPSNDDPVGDSTLEAMAEGGNGRFLFGSSRVHSSLDAQAGATPVSQVPGAFPLVAQPVRPGARVVSHDFGIGGWTPDAAERFEVPEKNYGRGGESAIYLWIVPANVTGRWQATLGEGPASRRFEFSIAQQFQLIEGAVHGTAQDLPLRGPSLRGDRIAFELPDGVGVRRGSTVSAQATGERMVGVVQVHDGDPAIPFVATRIRAYPDLYR